MVLNLLNELMTLPVGPTALPHAPTAALQRVRRAFREALSKSCAVLRWVSASLRSQGLPADAAATCHTSDAVRSTLAQGYPAVDAGAGADANAVDTVRRATTPAMAGCRHALRPAVRWIGCALGCAWAVLAQAGCPAALVVRFIPLGGGVWWVPAADGESSPANRGNVSNLLVARDGRRLWLVGSGPSPAFGRALACRARQHFGRAVTDVIDSWARAELVLGNAGFPAARLWAHREVAAAMGEQCPHCIERLRERIGPAATDLGEQPARLPARLLDGAQGRLGPFDWWALPRAAGRITTVWRHRASGVTSAHGLLWFDGPPDGRDAALQTLAESTARLAGKVTAGTRWIGEQGPPGPADAPLLQAAYWHALLGAAARGVAAGELAGDVPDMPGWPAALVDHPRHPLNWQRAWRQAEDRLLMEPPR